MLFVSSLSLSCLLPLPLLPPPLHVPARFALWLFVIERLESRCKRATKALFFRFVGVHSLSFFFFFLVVTRCPSLVYTKYTATAAKHMPNNDTVTVSTRC